MGRLDVGIDRAAFAFPEEALWLADWVLGDVAERRPAKRQREPLRGMWINRQGRNLRLRRSDQNERNYVAAVVLVSGGLSVKAAISEIGGHLGKTTARELDVLRTGVYRFRAPHRNQLAMTWLGSFRSWTDWVVTTSPGNLDFVANQFRSSGRPRQATQFLALAAKVRMKAVAFGRQSLYRDPAWYEQAECEYQKRVLIVERDLGDGPDQHLVGMARVSLARLYHEQGKFMEAIPAYERAASCWRQARIVEDLRGLMVGWIAHEVAACRNGVPLGSIPVYSGPWVPV
jgi:tetratricopeptide (TPR) repeat protein